MANYKSMITGTANALGTKAKDYVESGAFKDACLKTAATARCYAAIARLTLQINGQLEEQKDIFAELGRLLYNEKHFADDDRFAQLFAEIEESDRKIESMRAELTAAKAAIEAGKK